MAIKYRQIAEELRDSILSEQKIISYKLPTEKELCNKYRVSRQTIRQALRILTEEKLITACQGSGFFTVPLSEHLNKIKIVLLVSEDNEYIYPAFLSELQAALRQQGLSLTIYTTRNNYNKERAILTELLSQRPAVLLVEGIRDAFPNPNIDLYETLQLSGTNILFINTNYSQLQHISFVRSDDFEGGYLLGKHFITADFQKISCILPDFAANAKERYCGLLASYRDSVLPMPENDIFWYSYNDLSSLRTRRNTEFLTNFIRRNLYQQDAVFCYNDEIAYWLIKELSYADIKVPEQISIASFDNSYLCSISTPPITSLSMPAHGFCDEIADFVEKVIKQLSSYEASSYNKVIPDASSIYSKTLPWELISRSSVLTFSE